MQAETVAVQACGCIALPESVAQSIGMLPGATVSLEVDTEQRSVTLSLLAPSPTAGVITEACPISR